MEWDGQAGGKGCSFTVEEEEAGCYFRESYLFWERKGRRGCDGDGGARRERPSLRG